MLSLRARLVLIAVLASATVLAVLVMMGTVLRGSLGHRLAAARALATRTVEAIGGGEDGRRLLDAIDDGALGLCTPDGVLEDDVSRTPGEAGTASRPLPHDQQDALLRLCREAPITGGGTVEIAHPHDLVTLRTRRIDAGRAAWVIVRTAIVEPSAERRWTSQSFALGAVVLLLIATASSALVGLGRGARDLERALTTLRDDLRAPVPLPAGPEFARLTQGLKQMASYLADARDRERSLERDLAHREKLAALGRVVAGVAHEIRNPLAGIKLKLDVMARDASTSTAQRREIGSCLDEVERLDRVVRTLLTVAKKRQGLPSGRREPIALRPFLARRIALQDTAAPAVTFELVADDDEGAVLTDTDDLTRIVDNLLANAIDAVAGRGHVTLRIAAESASTTALRISDDGPGVDTERVGQLFTPFASSKEAGLGLGLWLSRALAEAIGGSLDFEGGSTFVLRLERDRA